MRFGICRSKDVVLHVIGVLGTAGGTGHVIEFCGDTVQVDRQTCDSLSKQYVCSGYWIGHDDGSLYVDSN